MQDTEEAIKSCKSKKYWKHSGKKKKYKRWSTKQCTETEDWAGIIIQDVLRKYKSNIIIYDICCFLYCISIFIFLFSLNICQCYKKEIYIYIKGIYYVSCRCTVKKWTILVSNDIGTHYRTEYNHQSRESVVWLFLL